MLPTVRRITAEWLTTKYGMAPTASGHHRLTQNATLTTQVIYDSAGTEQSIRLQLREEQGNATWRTTVTATAPDHTSSAVSVLLEAFANPGHTVVPGRPRLVRELVTALRPHDGLARLTLHAQEVDTDVEPLLHVLCDPDRQLPVIVAARPLRPDSLWSSRMRETMPNCAGAASLYLLRDVASVKAFREHVGEHHRVSCGAVRTFLPGVDPAWVPDAARHRFISYARMSDPGDSSWRGIARRVQQAASDTVLPAPLQHLAFPDVSVAHQADRQAALTADRSATDNASLRAEIGLLTELLAQADVDLREASRNADLATRTIAALQEQLEDATATGLRDVEDGLRALDDVARLHSEVELLRARLRTVGRHEDAVVVEEQAGVPQSFEELWGRLRELPGVLVTADQAKALALDESERARVWAAKAWNGLRALNSYALSSDFRGNFYQFCSAGIPGTAGWSHKQLGMNESRTTMGRWGEERRFPVPRDVDPSGWAQMKPHLKLDNGGRAPRIHFLDAKTQRIPAQLVVGYIGAHLTNTMTN
ncbi:hypothetical protein ACFXPX_32795 [Kitasatospora sp. NPDC059146]|uniref:hypothetical protein n=1 Tax=unclassified Kitasatospora TaxID=2633591 RepID=UPI003673D309